MRANPRKGKKRARTVLSKNPTEKESREKEGASKKETKRNKQQKTKNGTGGEGRSL